MPTKVCPVCESPLTTDAVRAGRCQCCGSDLPAAEDGPTNPAETEEETSEETSA